jgi:hypothetical protein
VLGRADPVDVDRVRVVLVDLASPRQEKSLRSGPPLHHRLLRHRLLVAPGRLCHERERGGRQPAEILLRLVVIDVDQLLQAPASAEHGEPRLEIGHVAAGPDRELLVGRRQPRLERVVDEETPHLLERDLADQLLDIDAAIAKRATFSIGLRDLGLERDDALESRLEVVHVLSAPRWLPGLITVHQRRYSQSAELAADAEAVWSRRGSQLRAARRSQPGSRRGGCGADGRVDQVLGRVRPAVSRRTGAALPTEAPPRRGRA